MTPTHINRNSWTIPLQGAISDPNLSDGSAAGSGVNPDTVQVTLLDENGDTAGQAAQAVTLSTAAWQIDYIFNGKRPNGLYHIEIQAGDLAGNVITQTIGSVRLDTYAGRVDLNQGSQNQTAQPNAAVQTNGAIQTTCPPGQRRERTECARRTGPGPQ